jgi:hypothetical protein
MGFGALALVAPEAGEADGRAEFKTPNVLPLPESNCRR